MNRYFIQFCCRCGFSRTLERVYTIADSMAFLQLWGIYCCKSGDIRLQLCPISLCNKQVFAIEVSECVRNILTESSQIQLTELPRTRLTELLRNHVTELVQTSLSGLTGIA